jgi:DNA polymerase IV (DinB-like DNA polymerase)
MRRSKSYNPALRGLPLVVGADPKDGRGRGVVMTANYQAKKFGIRSALPISRAWRLAQAARRRGEAETIFLHANFQLYETAFSRIMQIFEWFSDSVEEASIDEAYLDGSLLKSFNDAQDRMTALKKEILREERIGCSIGIAPNKLIAKIPPVEISRMA